MSWALPLAMNSLQRECIKGSVYLYHSRDPTVTERGPYPTYKPLAPGKGSQGNPIRTIRGYGPYQDLLGRLGPTSLGPHGLYEFDLQPIPSMVPWFRMVL